MLTPLGTNVLLADRLMYDVKSKQQKEMIRLILMCSKLALFHANDLLDYKIIQNGCFTSTYTTESIVDTIEESIQLMEYTLQNENLKI